MEPDAEVDLDESLDRVMGEVKSLKRAWQKQQGQQEQPTDQMYRCACPFAIRKACNCAAHCVSCCVAFEEIP